MLPIWLKFVSLVVAIAVVDANMNMPSATISRLFFKYIPPFYSFNFLIQSCIEIVRVFA